MPPAPPHPTADPERPAGYPAAFDRVEVLPTGETVQVRPIVPADVERHRRFVSDLSRDTKYFRFFTVIGDVTETQSRWFCTLDYHDRFALVAIDGDDLLAVARWDRSHEPGHETEAEVAFVVADRVQGHGIGTLLLRRLAEAAADRRIERFTAEVLTTNRAMLDVFRHAGYEETERFEGHGVIHVELPLDR